MARKRVIQPEFFSDGELWDALPDWALIFYIGTWVEADDSGVLTSDAATLKNRILPARSLGTPKVREALERLVELGKLVPFTDHGKVYYWLANFHRHQRLDYPTPPRLPLPPWVTWLGEDVYGEGVKGTEGYKPNRRKWHYDVGDPAEIEAEVEAARAACDRLKGKAPNEDSE